MANQEAERLITRKTQTSPPSPTHAQKFIDALPTKQADADSIRNSILQESDYLGENRVLSKILTWFAAVVFTAALAAVAAQTWVVLTH